MLLNVPNKGEQSQTCLSYADRAEQSLQGNVPNKRAQSQVYLNYAEHEEHLHKENVPNLRFPEFSGEWTKTSIGECFSKVENGLTYDTNNASGVPVTRIETISDKSINYDRVGYANIDDKISKYEMQYGDVLFSHINSLKHIGKTAFYDAAQPLYHGMNLLLLRAKKSQDSKFLYYTLNTHRFLHRCQVLANQAVNQASINTKELKGIKISVPQMQEQKKIAEFISYIDDRIATQIKIIEDLKKLKSAIRAKVFKQLESSCECWSEIGNMLQYEQPSKYLVTSTEYSDSYATPVLTANKAFILGYTDEEFGIYSKGECVIFDDFTMDVKFVNFPFKVKSSAIKILTANSSNDLYFVYEYLQNLGLVSEEHKRHYISEIEPMIVACPTFEEQQNISNLLRSFDSKIEYANRELILYNKQKQHLLSQMFI